MSKRVLVLGGVGFIGRNLVQYLVENCQCALIRVADKQPLDSAIMAEKTRQAYRAPNVEVIQANLLNQSNLDMVFAGDKFDVVYNLASETRFGQPDEAYKVTVVDLTVKCATEAAKRGAGLFVEVSTAQVYDSDKKPSKEESKIKPWTKLAKFKAQAEDALKNISGLTYIIVRPAIIYGPGDLVGLMPRLVCAVVYKQIKKKMKLLWGGDLKINTVHVDDVARALYHLAEHQPPSGAVFNLVDKNETDQKKVNEILESIFGIQTTFYSKLASKVGTVKMAELAEAANDKHMGPWVALCKEHGFLDTPLSPYMHKDLLKNHHLSIDGSAIENTGFRYNHPQVTVDLLKASVKYWIELRQFPAIL